ncbi:hypothetical protein [Thalassomonas actiniarum]|uniref:Solute-binding protein family 3/N-terminal domain-containing protein n=1 Tax=Thalassomonas actiniarum TaxID=485447 RepID=A0AAE9YLX4_9GAMM|nr:hypothetical protein [Thalassomonas actiniarum]WDD97392.1 hypothetical protein SG35_018980 [Thalassomonas actiniarum]
MNKSWIDMPFPLPVFLLLLFTFPLNAAPFIVNANEEIGDTLGTEHVKHFIRQLYAPLGINPSIVFLPNLRGLNMANQGQVDAEFSRYEPIAKAYPNLVKIAEPLLAVNAGLFCLLPAHCNLEPDNLYIRTKRSITIGNFCLNHHLSCQVVKHDNIAFNIMNKRGNGTYLSEYQVAVNALCQSGIKRIYYRHVPSLSQFSYHWIHNKHKHLLNQLTLSMINIKKSGLLKELLIKISGQHNPCTVDIITLPPLKEAAAPSLPSLNHLPGNQHSPLPKK